jgi:hypothetical protein
MALLLPCDLLARALLRGSRRQWACQSLRDVSAPFSADNPGDVLRVENVEVEEDENVENVEARIVVRGPPAHEAGVLLKYEHLLRDQRVYRLLLLRKGEASPTVCLVSRRSL